MSSSHQPVNRSELERFFAGINSRTKLAQTHFAHGSSRPPVDQRELEEDQRELERFFADVNYRVHLAERLQCQLDVRLATRFNVFDLIQPDENRLSDILAGLLDPKGNHGQGDLFLWLLLERLGLGPDPKLRTKDATVRREAPVHGTGKNIRRMVVFVEEGVVRKKLALDFLHGLESALRLKKELKEGWEFERWGCPFENGEAGFDFWKPAWKADYYVSLYFGIYGQEVTFGLGRDADKERIKNRPYIDGLLEAVKKHYSSATNRKWREAVVTMQPPDWRKPEVLWRMHTDHKFLEDVAEELLGVAEITEPIVDRFVDRWTRKKSPAANAASPK